MIKQTFAPPKSTTERRRIETFVKELKEDIEGIRYWIFTSSSPKCTDASMKKPLNELKIALDDLHKKYEYVSNWLDLCTGLWAEQLCISLMREPMYLEWATTELAKAFESEKNLYDKMELL